MHKWVNEWFKTHRLLYPVLPLRVIKRSSFISPFFLSHHHGCFAWPTLLLPTQALSLLEEVSGVLYGDTWLGSWLLIKKQDVQYHYQVSKRTEELRESMPLALLSWPQTCSSHLFRVPLIPVCFHPCHFSQSWNYPSLLRYSSSN